jgi:hypothetical protein
MRRPISVFALTTSALFVIAPLFAADDASFGNDLKATIALQGMPCDQVVQAKRNGDSDYTAACKDGNRYHVFVDPKGRVVVQKL